LWARVLPWSIVFGIALWIAYKFVKGVIIGLGLGGTGLPTTIGVLATLALYTASVRLRLLSSIFGTWCALGLSSALFGAWHLVIRGADLLAVLGVMFAGGIPATALYMVTGRLWASIGYHMAWNFTEAYVFGAGVSGSDFGPSLFQVRARPGVDALWSGGTFGPEASMVTLVFGLLVSAALITLAKRRKRSGLRRQRCCKELEATGKREEPGLSLPGSRR
jgi:membrane protease YdiL (CAAX protease family)